MSPNAIFLKILIEILRFILVAGIFFITMLKLVPQEQLSDLIHHHTGSYLSKKVLLGIGLALACACFISFIKWLFMHYVIKSDKTYRKIFLQDFLFFGICTTAAILTDLYFSFATV